MTYKTILVLTSSTLQMIQCCTKYSLFMSNVRYSLFCWGRANKKCINDINVLISRALRCIIYKEYDDSVRELKLRKNIRC